MAQYKIRFKLFIEEIVEADSEEAARQAFSELWDSAESMCDLGETTVEKI